MRMLRRAAVVLVLLPFAGCVTTRASDRSPAAPVWEQAEAARREDRFDAALAAYREALAVDPAFVPAHHGYQDLLLAAGREEDVRGEYAALALDPGEPWCLVLYGRVLFDAPREERLYRDALAAAPDDRDALAALGSALRRQMRYAEAADVLGRLADRSPDDTSAHFAFARAAHRAGRGAEVRARYERAAAGAPALPGPREVLAMLAAEDFDRQARRAHLEAVERLAPSTSAAGRARVQLAQLAEDQPELRCAVQALAEHPERTAGDLAYAASSLAYADARDPRVEEWLREARRLDPTSAGPIGRQALARVQARRLLGVDDLVGEALRRDPTDTQALAAAARLAVMRKDEERAIELYRRRLAADEDPWTRRALGRLLAERGRLAQAIEMLAAEPDLATRDLWDPAERDDALAQEIWLRCNAGDWVSAWERAARRLGDADCSPYLLAAGAEARWLLGDSQGALGLLERASARAEAVDAPAARKAWLETLRVRCLLRAGRRDDACAVLVEISERFPTEVPDGYPLEPLLAAMAAGSDERESFLPEAWPRARTEGGYVCLPDACRALLEARGAADTPDVRRALAEMPGELSAACEMLRAAGLDPVVFRIDREGLRRLLREGRLVLVSTYIVRERAVAGHAALAVGYDDRLGIVHVEDVSLRSIGFLTDDQVEGRWGLVLQEPDGPDLRARSAGVEHWETRVEAERLLRVGDASGALQATERALALDPDGAEALFLRKQALCALKRHDEELDSLQRASALPRASLFEHLNLGKKAVQRRDVEALRVAVGRAKAIAPETLLARRLELRLEALEEQSAARIRTAADGVLEIDLNDAEALYWKGYACLWQGDVPGAIENLEQSLGLHEVKEGWWYLADARSRTGDAAGSTDALEHYRGMLVAAGAPESALVGVDARIAELEAEAGDVRVSEM